MYVYLNFVLKLFFAFGIAFEIPIAAILLIWAGITTPDDLSRKRPYVIVGCFIFGMLLTPPDVISQSLLAVPMWLLFELGVFFGRLIQRDEDEVTTWGTKALCATMESLKSGHHPLCCAHCHYSPSSPAC